MAWIENPALKDVLSTARTVDVTIKTDFDAANPGVLKPTQAVVHDGQTFTVGAKTVTVHVAKHVVTLTEA